MSQERVCSELKIYIATISDYEKICDLVDCYVDDGEGIAVERDTAKRSLKQILKMNGIILLEVDGQTVGGIAGYVIPGLFNKDKFFSTLFFYVRPLFRKYTKKFISLTERMLKEAEVTKLVFGIPYGYQEKQMSRFYEILGYKVLEVHYYKEI